MSHFQRWSRRKRGVIGDGEFDEAPPAAARDAIQEAGSAPPADPVAPPEAPATDPEADLPDPDTLPPGSDITAFMAPGVSAGLRRRALKRLFAADHYGIRDGLDDYDQDFRRTLTPLAGQAAERLRRWLDAPASGRDDAADGASREVAGESPPLPREAPREDASGNDGDGESDGLAGHETPSPATNAGDAPLDQGPLARTGKSIKT